MQSLDFPHVALTWRLAQQTFWVVPSVVGAARHEPIAQLSVQVGRQCAGAMAAQAKPLPQSAVLVQGLEHSPGYPVASSKTTAPSHRSLSQIAFEKQLFPSERRACVTAQPLELEHLQ